MTATTLIPIPADLPTPWEQEGDQRRFWNVDPMHFPNPMTTIDDVFVRMVFDRGMNHAFETYEMPLRAEARRFWTHLYMSISPLDVPEDVAHAMGLRSEEKLGAAMGSMMQLWETTWLPEIKEHVDYWKSFDLKAATHSQLLTHLDETLSRLQRAWALHFEIVFAAQTPVSLFDEFYRDLFGDENPFAAYLLVQGFDNLTVRGGTELWKLSRKAQESSEVRAILEQHEPEDVIDALEACQDGRAFLTDLDAYLSEYGQRGSIWGLSYTSWVEDPTPVIKHLKDYISQPERDPDVELAELAAEREQHVASARERLQSYPEPVRRQFEFLLKAAQDGNVLSEDHGHWIDFRICYYVRRVFMEFGHRFTEAGVIESADDIFHLTPDEIRETALLLPDSGVSRALLVAERKAEIDEYATIKLPPAIGTQPLGPPPVNPMTQMLGKFFGTPPKPSSDPNKLNGSSGSPGVVRGTARVVHSLADAGRVRPGEILIAETTAPPWTPLFATVAAVVTDTGGILSHCAVVAREYRIPAVVGVGVATSVIQDGQTVEVDGDRGVVTIVS